MNTRERFLEIMNFNTKVHSLKWEFGYWGETLDNWYKNGLPRKKYPVINKEITTPTSSLYSTAWTCSNFDHLPKGLPVTAGGLYYPTQGFPLDHDVKEHFGMDMTQQVVDVNLHFSPMFDIQVINEDEKNFEYVDIDGVRRVFLKDEATIPTSLEWPIKDRASWEKLKEERLNLKNIKERFPANWNELLQEYRDRDYPIAIGGIPMVFSEPLLIL